ncbi:DUF5313 domain-containing protein [Gordonia sp. ABSL1-1]|uniref:DUF5313 domain-containing protein n=1 Tax=Gordonia sp. ABSL1-1 TaxID=3053923 RepID=UPI00257381FE|nr:DUF5313 domain-containing protein [Gordonia sp. ABSL1-1]MDL9935254.1 DUF5313 domain-containing protein [Gordonia sp. ABSL1-1]
MTDARTAPTTVERIKYAYGAKLPASMREWVANDLAGPGAAFGMVAFWAVPCVILLVPMLFVPADWLIRANMTIPILVPYIFFSIALNRVYRRYRLSQHGLDPELINKRERERNADVYDEYYRKYRGGQR